LLFSQSNSGDQPPLAASLIPQSIKAAITHAHAQIQLYAQTRPQIHTMGTTIALAMIDNNTVYIGNVGDSRVYLYRQGHVTQITQDHSWAAELVRTGKIDEDELVNHPRRNILYRSLGTTGDDEVIVDLFERKLQAGDKLLLCSDGLWQAFPLPTKLAEWLDEAGSPTDICRHLVAEAKQRDGSDNISAIVVNVAEGDCLPSRRSIINRPQRMASVLEQ
jgi:PPM family protein phosphatase